MAFYDLYIYLRPVNQPLLIHYNSFSIKSLNLYNSIPKNSLFKLSFGGFKSALTQVKFILILLSSLGMWGFIHDFHSIMKPQIYFLKFYDFYVDLQMSFVI